MSLTVHSLDHLVLTVRDLDATVTFYSTVLGMKPERFEAADGTRRVALRFGPQKINLHLAGYEFEPKALQPAPGSADLCFLVDGGAERWAAHLKLCGISVEEGPVRRTGATGPILSLYLRDPDGNLIELGTPVSG